MNKAQIYFTKKAKLLAIVLISIFLGSFVYQSADAATGINSQINFQGKVVNKTAGTNVTNGDYDFIFRLYSAPSGGSLLWTENHTSANDVTVTDGIFRVALGSITSLSSVDFNSDSIYLEIEFEGETMGTRIRFASVPYAFNAQMVNGLTVTNNGGNTLSIAANKTFTVSNSLTLTGTDSTSFAFPSTGGGTVIVSNISGQSIAGAFSLTGASGNLSLAGTTGLTFSGVGGDITFTNGEKIDNDSDGVIAITGDLDASGAFSAGTGNAFAVNSSGAITASAGLTLTSGAITLGGLTGSGQCLVGGPTASWGSCGSGSGTNYWNLNASNGLLTPINGTMDLLLGFGALTPATTSAKFSVIGMAGAGPATASVSGNFIIQSQNGAGGRLGIGTNNPGSIIDAVRNQNAFTSIQVTNANNGTNASADLLANNDIGAYIDVGIGSSGYTLVPMLQNRAYLYTGSASDGLVLYTSGSTDPILFATDDLERMRVTELGLVGIGTTSPISGLHVTRALSQGATGKALAIFDQIENQDVLSASKSGVTKFTVGNTNTDVSTNLRGAIDDSFFSWDYTTNRIGFTKKSGSTGKLTYGSANSFAIAQSNASGIDAANTFTDRFLIDSSGSVNIGGDATPNALFTVGSSSQFQVDGSGNITVNSCSGCGGGGSTNYFNQQNGLTWLGNTTSDFAIGGNSSASAKFVFGGSNAGVPTATFSGDLIINNRPTTANTDMQKWDQITSTAGTIGGNATTGIASVSASVVYNGSLYVGTNKTNGAEVYRYDGRSTTWTKVTDATAGTITSGGTANIDMISSMTVWNGSLYIGTSEPNAAEVYRYDGGTTWTKVSNATAGTIRASGTSAIDGVVSMAVFQSKLYIGTAEGAKAEIYRYETGTSWIIMNTTPGTFVATNTASVDAVSSIISYQGSLYFTTKKTNDTDFVRFTGVPGSGFLAMNAAGTTGSYNIYNTESGGASAVTGYDDGLLTVYAGRIVILLSNLNTSDVLMWSPNEVVSQSNVFIRLNASTGTIRTGGTSAIDSITAFAIYGGRLYIGTGETNAAQIYRYNGALGDWTLISQNTAGQINSGGTTGIDAISTLISFNHNSLFAGILEGTATQGYMYQSAIDQSYSIKFNAASSYAGGEQNGQENLGSIFFVASLSANLNNRQGNTGAFVFSHNLVTNNGSYDVAEDYPTRELDLEPGDLVSVDPEERGFVVKSNGAYDYGLIGVYSESPALRLSQQSEEINGGKAVPIALAGRVLVKVSTENGKIKNGDYLTSSSIPGVAMRATKSSIIIGVAMDSYEGDGVGKVMTYIKSNSYNGSIATTFASIDPSSVDFADQVLDQLMNSSMDGKSSVITDRLIAGLEVITPKITVDTIIAKHIKAESIELPDSFFSDALKSGGLNPEEGFTKEINEIKDQIAVLSAETKASTESARSSQEKLMESINEKLSKSTESATMTQNSTLSTISLSDGISIIDSTLRVKGNGLFENMLTVIDTLTTNHFISNGLSTFFGKSVFKDEVDFQKAVTFSNDSGGEIVIPKDQKKVEVRFSNEFTKTPVINVSVAFEEQKDDSGNVKSSEDLESKFFEQNYSYIIVNKSKNGFAVVLNKKAEDDIYFTWTALQVKDEISIQNRGPN